MPSIDLIFASILLMALSGVPACLLNPRSGAGQRITAFLMTVGGASGLVGLALSPAGGPGFATIAGLGGLAIEADPIAAIFLALVFIVAPLGSIYALGYWKQAEHADTGRRLGIFYGILSASMALVLVARDGLSFLIAWEAMALSAYFASTAESDQKEVRKAGWIYLIATHVGTLCLFAMFALMRAATGSFAFAALTALAPGVRGAIFVLAVVGFGLKAGIMPLHLWLPGAHANAPSHVSALMSGVMLKMGVYGIVRITSLLPDGADWWGASLLGIGVLTSLAGILFATGQKDLKRALAYSSIENIGIIAMGLGFAVLGRGLGRWDWVALGMGGALLHCVNHALFKPLLFLGAGSVIHGSGTREMDRMGGLAKAMPRTAALFAVGAVAICALPPLNGFSSEWLLYLGFFRALGATVATTTNVAATGSVAATTTNVAATGSVAAMTTNVAATGSVAAATPSVAAISSIAAIAVAAVALAMVGALALACFVKIYGAIFLGSPRGGNERVRTHESGASMLAPMAMLAAACVLVGLFAGALAPFLSAATGAWIGRAGDATAARTSASLLSSLAPFSWITRLGIALVALAVIVAFATLIRGRERRRARKNPVPTWDCGYAEPKARMEYTGSSFTRSIGKLFRFVLWPKTKDPTIVGVFPRPSRFESSLPDPVLDRLLRPLFGFAERQITRAKIFQQGQTQLYVLYVLVITIALLVFTRLGA